MGRSVAIVGIGHTKFGNREGYWYRDLAAEAASQAFQDAGLTPKDMEFSVISMLYRRDRANIIAEALGLIPQGTVRVEAACGSGSAAIRMAYANISSGLADIGIVIGVEKMVGIIPQQPRGPLVGGDSLWEMCFGLTMPSYFALFAIAHMQKYGTTEEHLAKIAVKNHYYGARNPLAQFQREITVDDVLKSRVISWPLKLYDCCPISDGAAAVILASQEVARKITDTPIWIKGLGWGTDAGSAYGMNDFTRFESTIVASRQAYKMAKLEPKDIDVAYVHDCFTSAELIHYEDLGFCEKGEGGKLIDEGQTYIGGKIPVNVDGGLKAKGHPIGATGVAMAAEAVKQLRGEAEKSRQVDGAEHVLTHNLGFPGITYVHIYSRQQ